jgi:hypothetical protein
MTEGTDRVVTSGVHGCVVLVGDPAHTNYSSFFASSSFTSWGFAWPFDAFIT